MKNLIRLLVLLISVFLLFNGCSKDDTNSTDNSGGITWEQVTTNSDWSARWAHSCAVFNDKMFILGGCIDANAMCTNDVWSSSNGIDWINVSPNAAWSKRFGHSSVVFNDKIWVLGGADENNEYLSDVWSSSNGIDWINVNSNADWGGRWDHCTVTFQNKIWVIGGNKYEVDCNDVWNSSDGINWTQVVASAPWQPRWGHKVIEFNGSLILMGGVRGVDANNHTVFSDVWTSSDGINWEQIITTPELPQSREHEMVVLDNKLFIIGCDYEPDYWFTEDAINWTKGSPNPSWPDRVAHKCVEYESDIWLLGGQDRNASINYNDIWKSKTDVSN